MAKQNPYRPYSANAEFKELLGSHNGNTVNGLGETALRAPSMVWWTPDMADADFGYVGAAPGKIDLYVGKDRVKSAIPEAEAVDRLVELIQEEGKWIQP